MDRLTELKTEDIKRRGHKVTGYILADEEGNVCIVNNAAVKWLSDDEIWDFMHETKRYVSSEANSQ